MMRTRCTGRHRAGYYLPVPVLVLVLYCLFLFPPNVSSATDSPADSPPPSPAASPAPKKSATRPKPKNIALPGLVINFKKGFVDIESTVCLDHGALELVACTKGTKEHESLVSIKACAMHIHTALLLLGANPGNPLMHRPVDKEGNRWITIPPRGDPVQVVLVFKDKNGKTAEHALREFVSPTENNPQPDIEEKAGSKKAAGFPGTFLFAGSHLRDNGPGPRDYLADVSGNVISIASFGDELLCLPGRHAHANGALLWQVNAATLPKVGTKVLLRLRPQRKKRKKAPK